MATPGTLRPQFPNVWGIDLLWEMGPAGIAVFFFFHVSSLQIGILGFGITEAAFLIVSINIYLSGGPPRRHLESRHIEYPLWEIKHVYNIRIEKRNVNLAGMIHTYS